MPEALPGRYVHRLHFDPGLAECGGLPPREDLVVVLPRTGNDEENLHGAWLTTTISIPQAYLEPMPVHPAPFARGIDPPTLRAWSVEVS